MNKPRVLNNYGSFDVTFVKGKGAVLTDVNGKKYIDFLAGIAVNVFGHGFKPVVKAVSSQAKKMIHVCNYFTSDIGIKYAQKLLKATGFDGVYFGNSGAEANEAAIKLARKYGQLNGGSKRKTIVTLKNSFHGRTIATLTATAQDKFHPEDFAPYVEGFKSIEANSYEGLESAFDETTAAFFFEPVLCEGGVIPLDKEWIQKACELARKAGAIIICDEVQTGMGRTGALLGSDALGIHPDAITFAKAIAGGVPMGACVYRGKADVFKAGDHQSTFAGNPLACAAADAVLDNLLKPGFFESVSEKGEYMRSVIKSWNLPFVKDVRGTGLITGVQVSLNPHEVEKKCLEAGLLFATAGADVLRFVPPLNITKKELDAGLSILHGVLALL